MGSEFMSGRMVIDTKASGITHSDMATALINLLMVICTKEIIIMEQLREVGFTNGPVETLTLAASKMDRSKELVSGRSRVKMITNIRGSTLTI